LVLFGLYFLGATVPLVIAWIFRRTFLKGPKPPLLIELPNYRLPSPKGIGLGLLERSKLFLRRAGTVILTISVALWFLASYPKAPEGASGEFSKGSGEPAIYHSYAGKIGRAIEPLLKPIGFDWRVGIALIPGFAAREVMVSALGTVYSIESAEQPGEPEDEDSRLQNQLAPRLVSQWSLATALSLLIWYVFAPQCISTLAVTRRETNSWRWPLFMFTYLTGLAYSASFLTYRLVTWLMGSG
jgi:ferrous iron transport protein B